MTTYNPWTQEDADEAHEVLKEVQPGAAWRTGPYRVRGAFKAAHTTYLVPDPTVRPASDFYHADHRWCARHRGKVPASTSDRVAGMTAAEIRSSRFFLPYIPQQFNPAIVKSVLHELGGGRVLDPCAGWGDRLAAAMATSSVQSYLGIDPNSALAAGYKAQASRYGSERHRVIQGCAEDVLPGIQDEYDVVFTSPPYFDTEIYSSEPTQSCNRFPTYERWVTNFFDPLITHSLRILRPGGYLALCLADVWRNAKLLNLCEMAHAIAGDQIGRGPDYCWGMHLKSDQQNNPLCERIFVWRK